MDFLARELYAIYTRVHNSWMEINMYHKKAFECSSQKIDGTKSQKTAENIQSKRSISELTTSSRQIIAIACLPSFPFIARLSSIQLLLPAKL